MTARPDLLPRMPEPELVPPPGREPRGYFLALSMVSDIARFQQYRSVIAKLREIYGGRDLVRAQRIHTIIGPPTENLLSIVEHPTLSDLSMLLSSPEYLALRDKIAVLAPGPVWSAKGVWPPPNPREMGTDRRAYAVGLYRIDNPGRHAQYRELIGRLVTKHGGQFLVRLDPVAPQGRTSDGKYLTLVEFPSLNSLQSAVHSQDYKDMVSLDIGHGERTLWVVEGAEG